MPRRPTLPMLPTAISLAQCFEDARDQWEVLHLDDELANTATHLPAALHAEARRRGHRTLGDLLHDSSGLLSAVSGQKNLAQYTSAAQRRETGSYRNTLASLVTATAMRHHAHAGDALALLPKLPAQHNKRLGPASDDEILTLRSMASYRAWVLGDIEIACQYALTEAGARPSETTVVTPMSFNDLRRAVSIHVPGLNGVAQRRLTVPRWSRELLNVCLDRQLGRHANAVHSPLLYRGTRRAGGAEASAAASGNISQLLVRGGYDLVIKPPTSVVWWRVTKTLDTEGHVAAQELSGVGYRSSFWSLINRRPSEKATENTEGPETYLAQSAVAA